MEREQLQKPDQEVSTQEEREQKKRKRISRIVLVCCIAAGVVLGLLLSRGKTPAPTEKVFDADGLQLTLATRFQETGDRGAFDRAYRSNHEGVYVVRESFVSAPEAAEISAEEYARRITALSEHASEPRTENGLTLFTCVREIDGSPCDCLTAVYKGSDAFWQVLFTCKQGSLEKYREDFLRFAASAVVP